MNYKQFKTIRLLIIAFIACVVGTASIINNFYLAITGVLIGVLFLYLVRIKFKKVMVDERVISLSGKAARMAYSIPTLILAVLGLFLIFSGRGKLDIYTESIGTIFTYIAMLNITIYAISFHYFNKIHGGE